MSAEERDRSPAGRFIYLAEKRVAKAITSIQSVAKLSDRKNYYYTDEQVAQIIEALESSLDTLKQQFSKSPDRAVSEFKFKND